MSATKTAPTTSMSVRTGAAPTQSGVYEYDDMSEAEYFAHPALSCSGAKLLLPPNCPAIYKHARTHKRPDKAVFDIGHMAHKQVLGVGAPLQLVEADDWRTKAAKEQRDAAYAVGSVPLLAKDWELVQGVSAAILAHPIASALFEPGTGWPELSLFWRDDLHGIDKRARVDWLRPAVDGRAIAVDLKTCVSAEPTAIGKAVANYGYSMQADFYTEGITSRGLAEDVAFLFVFVEKTPPHLITVCELDAEALRHGRVRNERASQVFAECSATDTWPAYSTDIELISLPRWATYVEDFAA